MPVKGMKNDHNSAMKFYNKIQKGEGMRRVYFKGRGIRLVSRLEEVAEIHPDRVGDEVIVYNEENGHIGFDRVPDIYAENAYFEARERARLGG